MAHTQRHYKETQTYDDILPPPQHAPGNDEVLLLRLVAEQLPPPRGAVVMRQPRAARYAKVHARLVNRAVLFKEIELNCLLHKAHGDLWMLETFLELELEIQGSG